MAMAPCKECKQQISTEAKVCPHCGKKNPTGGWSLGAKIGVGLLAIVLLGQFRCPRFQPSVMSSTGTSLASRPAGPLVPASESSLLNAYASACSEYDGQPNEIKKSEVYRQSLAILQHAGPVTNWVGTLKSIRTNQGGSNATLVINIGSSDLRDDGIALGSPVYLAASEMREGQPVTFSGRGLTDFNITERGKVCSPDFEITLTSVR